MTTKTKTRLEEFITSVDTERISVNVDDYPPSLEFIIQQAVGYKREGQYDKAINIYLDLLKQLKCANLSIASFMYKVVICAEEFRLAYRLITVIGYQLVIKKGPRCPIRPFPGGPIMGYIKWAPTDYRDEFELACKQSLRANNVQSLLEYVKLKSGNPSYKFTKSSSQILQEISQLI